MRGVQSKPPGVARTFPCPNCGAPWAARRRARSSARRAARSSTTAASTGSSRRSALDSMRRAPADADHRDPPERGTDLPTYRQPDVDAHWMELVARRSGAVTEQRFIARVGDDLRRAQRRVGDATSSSRSAASSPTGSSTICSTGSTPTSARACATSSRTCAITRHAASRRSSRDALLRRDHDPHLGHRQGLRRAHRRPASSCAASSSASAPYSEYWTLDPQRRAQGRRRAPSRRAATAAPARRSRWPATCDHCGAHVTAGEFDWVLSKIEQDDTYRG